MESVYGLLIFGLLALWSGLRGLLPSFAIREALATLLAADTATLAAASANRMKLISAPFALQETTDYASLTFANFTGSGPISGVAGAQLVGQDVDTGDWVITIETPAGGWRWITGDLTHLPQTIYGAALVDNGQTTVLGLLAFDTPITLTAASQVIDLGTVKMTFVQQPIS